ncbi:hypothetical protein M1278_02900 [Candidatus Marsarchaeota archaeon]|nr:hypothetical protein [Candidatus Marsarchaeota archaeon]
MPINNLDSNSTSILSHTNLLTNKNPRIQILSIGSMFSGTKVFSKDALVGLNEVLIEKKINNDNPDILILNGGILPYGALLPYLPKISAPRRWDKILSLSDNIKYISDASEIIKVHLNRIFNTLDKNTKVVYVLGDEDKLNISDIARSLNSKFNYSPEFINELYLEFQDMIESRKEIIKITNAAVKKIDKILKILKNNKKKDYSKKINEFESKNEKNHQELIKIQQETKELNELKTQLYDLYLLSFNLFDVKKLKKLKLETKDQLKKTMDEINKAKDPLSNEYKKLEQLGKKLSNKLRAIDIIKSELKNAIESQELAIDSKRIDTFTGNIPIEPQSAKMIENLSHNFYYYILNSAFGRKRQIEIIGKNNLNLLSFSKNNLNLNTLITNNPTNTSNNFKINANSSINITIGNLSKSFALEPNLAIAGHTTTNSFTIIPSQNNSDKNIAVLCSGPLVDSKKVFELWNQKLKTELTSAFEKSRLFSGITIIEYDGTSFSSDVIKFDYLINKANQRYESKKEKEALEVLKEKLRTVKNPDNNTNHKFREEKIEKLTNSNKLASEIRDKDLEYINLDNFNNENKIINTQKLTIASISDIHFGSGETNMDILKACVKDIAANPPNVLILNGDIIEGNLNNYMNVLKEYKKPEIINEFETWLKNTKKLKEQQILEHINAFYKQYINNMPIQNIDAQVEPLLKILSPAIDKIVESKGHIIITSGNHYNKTYKDNKLDEAEKLAGALKLYINGKTKDFENVKVIHGASDGTGIFSINDRIKILVSHDLGKDISSISDKLRKKNSEAQISIGSHRHQMWQGDTTDTSIDVTPSITSVEENSFLQSTKDPIGKINGYVYSEYEFDENKVIRHKSSPKLNNYFNKLRTENLFEEFLSKKTNLDINKNEEKSDKQKNKIRN